MKKSVIVGKDVNYAASKTSATVNTALTPDLLADGAIGVYGIDKNTNKLVLITDAASGTGLKAAAAGIIDEMFLAVGTSTAHKITGNINPATVKVKSSAYVAPVKGVFSVGYNTVTSSGSLNLPSTILKGDELQFKVIDKNNVDGIVRSGDSYSGFAKKEGATGYEILKDLSNTVDEDPNKIVVVDIVGNGTSTAVTAAASGSNKSVLIAAVGTPLVTGSIAKGEKTLTLTLATSTISSVNFTGGDLIEIAGKLYSVSGIGATGAASIEITLGREYKGATLSGAAASNFKFFNSANPTEFGFTLTDLEDDLNTDFATLGLISSADTAVVTAAVKGNGTYTNLAKAEENSWTRTLRRERIFSLPAVQAVLGVTYDQYHLDVANPRAQDVTGSLKSAIASITLAFPSTVADTVGKNQSNFEDILEGLGISFTSLF